MATKFLCCSGPLELVVHIMASCATARDALALAKTCRHTHNVWLANGAFILWQVWLRELPCFDDALIASRLTSLVVEAEANQELPPVAISPAPLSGHRQMPTFTELKAARGLRRVATSLAGGIGHLRMDVPNDRNGWQWREDDVLSGPEDPARRAEWELSITKACQRLLVCGAALAGVYRQPFFAAMSSGDSDLERIVTDDFSLSSSKQLSFIEGFAICNLEAPFEQQEPIFGPLGDWLIDSILSDSEARVALADRFEKGYGRARVCQSRANEPCHVKLARDGVTHADAHLLVWEVMKVVWLSENLDDLLARPYKHYCPRPVNDMFLFADNNWRAVAVFFGTFRAEEVAALKRYRTIQAHTLAADLVAFPLDEKSFTQRPRPLPGLNSVANLFGWIYECSGRPNSFEETGDNVPPLRLKFFEYFLRRHTNTRFLDDAFHQDEYAYSFREFRSRRAIFAFDDVEGRLLCDPQEQEEYDGEEPYHGRIFCDFECTEVLDGSELLTSVDEPLPTRIFLDRMPLGPP